MPGFAAGCAIRTRWTAVTVADAGHGIEIAIAANPLLAAGGATTVPVVNAIGAHAPTSTVGHICHVGDSGGVVSGIGRVAATAAASRSTEEKGKQDMPRESQPTAVAGDHSGPVQISWSRHLITFHSGSVVE